MGDRTLSIDTIEQSFREKVCQKVSLVGEGVDRYRVLTPFMFDDGDHLAIVLRYELGRWVLSDEGHTFMHLTYDIDEKDLSRGNRQKIICSALSRFGVEDSQGELRLTVPGEEYGDALYSFVQALVRISDISFLSRERVRSTFIEDFQSLMSETVPEDRRTFYWRDVQRDPRGMYEVDCRVNSMAKPLFVFALPGDDSTRDATIKLLQFERWGIPHRSVAVFEDQEEINPKVLVRFTDVCGKTFSSLSVRPRIVDYVKGVMVGENL
jgi:hypothetical protein